MTSPAPRATSAPAAYSPHARTPHPVDESLLDRACALGPVVREHADATERARRLAAPVLAAMRDAGMFRLFTPRARGGLEVDPVTFARIVEEVATFDSAAAWAMQAGNTGAWWVSRCSAEGVDRLFADGPDMLMSASFMPPHPAVRIDGGYRLNGRGALASTVHDSPWVMMTGMVIEGGKPRMTPAGPELVALVMPTRDVEIVDTWQSLGMRGTDSNDIVARDVWVPQAMSYPLTPTFTPAPGFEGPLYRMPAPSSSTLVIVPTALAVARGAIDELRALAERRTPMGAMHTMRHRAAVQSAIAEAEAMLRAARLLFYDTVAATWRTLLTGDAPTLEQRADLMLAGTHATQASAHVVDLVHRACGTAGIYARSRLERHLRDAHTIRHHALACEARMETAGQVYLGVEPDFPFVFF
jgi:alkylation response protein AidB-like acyl-CoA dehydrogenase